jgi:hypothetical protein
MLASVYTCDGRCMLGEGEIEEELARKDAGLEHLRRLLAARQGRNE